MGLEPRTNLESVRAALAMRVRGVLEMRKWVGWDSNPEPTP
jgi:hypothetical protein